MTLEKKNRYIKYIKKNTNIYSITYNLKVSITKDKELIDLHSWIKTKKHLISISNNNFNFEINELKEMTNLKKALRITLKMNCESIKEQFFS